jgi:hypothetical protein
MSWLFGYEVGPWSTMHARLPIRVLHGAPAVTGTHRWLGSLLTRQGSDTYFWRHPIAARPHRGHQPTVWVPGHWRNPLDLRLLGTEAHHNHLTLTSLDRHRPKQTTTSILCIPNLGLRAVQMPSRLVCSTCTNGGVGLGRGHWQQAHQSVCPGQTPALHPARRSDVLRGRAPCREPWRLRLEPTKPASGDTASFSLQPSSSSLLQTPQREISEECKECGLPELQTHLARSAQPSHGHGAISTVSS